MMTTAAPSLAWADRSVRAMIRRWLALVNSIALMCATLPWLGPHLERAGYRRLGGPIFALYRPLCHQVAWLYPRIHETFSEV